MPQSPRKGGLKRSCSSLGSTNVCSSCNKSFGAPHLLSKHQKLYCTATPSGNSQITFFAVESPKKRKRAKKSQDERKKAKKPECHMSDTRFDKKRPPELDQGESQKGRRVRKSDERCEKAQRCVGPFPIAFTLLLLTATTPSVEPIPFSPSCLSMRYGTRCRP